MKNIVLLSFFLIGSLKVSAQEIFSQIDLDSDSFEEFEIFGDTLDDYQVYFTGENHMYATFNSELMTKFLKFLHQKQNVKHLIFEQSPAVGYIIDKVICEGKNSYQNYLEEMFYTPYFEMITNIRAYNDKLNDEDKIHIHGIDAERFPYFSVYALDQIVDTLDTRFEGGELFEQIKALASAHYEDYNVGTYYDEPDFNMNFGFGEVHAWASLQSIISGAYELKDTLMPRLGKDGPIFYAIIKSLEAGREWYLGERAGDVKSPIIRERFMCDEFERIYRIDPTGKYYGQFGRCHIQKDKTSRNCYDYYMNSIAARISEIDKSLYDKVLVIPIFYSKQKNMDGETIEDLNMEGQFLEDGTSYIIDLSYRNGQHQVSGFYKSLPYFIICNEAADGYEDTYFVWDIPLEEYHIGAYYGHYFFNKLDKLDNALESFGSVGFTNKFLAYTFVFDYIFMNNSGTRVSYTHIPSVSNFDGFQMDGYLFSWGGYMPLGNRWLVASLGYDMAYGRMLLTEETQNTVPNLIQQNGMNVNIYRNDVFLFDPNVEFRITLPLVSLNLKAGYAFDISSKYWKLDGKMKDFTKTSFTAPYLQAGVSLHIKN